MAATDQQEVIAETHGYAGGVNMRDAINQLAPDQARRMENGVLNERGAFSKRLGCQSQGTFGASGDRILSQYVFYRAGSTPQLLIHTSGGALYYTNDPTANPITWTLIASSLSTTAPFSFETFNSKAYFSNGVDSYASWDGSTYATYASAPKGAYLRLWKDTMWVSGIVGLPDRVYSSAAGDAQTFPVSNWIDIAKGDGDSVTALGTDGLMLIVFKLRRHVVIYDPVTFANRVVDFEKGCESHFSVMQFEGSVYFLSRRGVCRYVGDSPADIISGVIDPLFDPTVLNLAALSKAYAYTVDNRIGWALPEAGFTRATVQLEYYPRLAGVTPYGNRGTGPFNFHRMPATTFSRWRSGANEYLYGGHSTANKFLRLYAPVGTDDGSAFTALLETSAYDFNAPDRTKYVRRLRVLGRGRFTVQMKRDFQSAVYKTFPLDLSSNSDLWGDENWGAGTWGPAALFQEDRVNTDAYGRYITLQFSDAETGLGARLIEVGSQEYRLNDGEWGLYGVQMEAAMLGVRDT